MPGTNTTWHVRDSANDRRLAVQGVHYERSGEEELACVDKVAKVPDHVENCRQRIIGVNQDGLARESCTLHPSQRPL
jgi:hypothetical protein